MYQVPRKSYRDFHSDIFPDTNGFRSELKPQDWMNGKNYVLPKISLDPAKTDIADMAKEVSIKLLIVCIYSLNFQILA